MSKAEEFMKSAWPAERRMEAALRRYERCKSLAEKVTSSMDGDTVSRTRDVTSHESSILALIEAQEEVDRCIESYTAAWTRIYQKLALINQELAELLELHYLKHMNMTAISIEVCRARSWVYVSMNEALLELEKVLD